MWVRFDQILFKAEPDFNQIWFQMLLNPDWCKAYMTSPFFPAEPTHLKPATKTQIKQITMSRT